MDAEQVVIDGAFDQVEQAPTDQEEPDEGPDRPERGRSPTRPPEEGQPGGGEDVGDCVEEPVGEGLDLRAPNRGRRPAIGAAQQAVPLEDLVEDDAVEEAAESHAQQQRSAARVALGASGRATSASQNDFGQSINSTTRSHRTSPGKPVLTQSPDVRNRVGSTAETNRVAT